jgi:hypothetical protein
MTLVIAVTAKDTIWLATDRRLSAGKKVVTDLARKSVMLETTDGVAMLGYAGLGRTAGGTEPSDWIGRVLRGRNWPLEQALGAVSEAMQREMPHHLHPKQLNSHHFLVPSFIGNQSRLYSIELALIPGTRNTHYRYTRWVGEGPLSQVAPRFALAGSGATRLIMRTDWQRELLSLVKAHDRGRAPALLIADKLAALNAQVHSRDRTVGSGCLVAWRYRKKGAHKGGGAHQFYSGTARVMPGDGDNWSFPQISNGMDVGAIVAASMPFFARMFEDMQAGRPGEIDHDQINAKLALLPSGPDDKLR